MNGFSMPAETLAKDHIAKTATKVKSEANAGEFTHKDTRNGVKNQ